MLNPQCEKCIWSGQCYSAQKCDDFYPAMSQFEDTADEEMLSRHRSDYQKEWNEAAELLDFLA